jgi:hypothetical protein
MASLRKQSALDNFKNMARSVDVIAENLVRILLDNGMS